jgi:hypothetical protein
MMRIRTLSYIIFATIFCITSCVPKEKEAPIITMLPKYDTIILSQNDFFDRDSLLIDGININIKAEAEINRISIIKMLATVYQNVTDNFELPNYINKTEIEFDFQIYLYKSELIAEEKITYRIAVQDENGETTNANILFYLPTEKE